MLLNGLHTAVNFFTAAPAMYIKEQFTPTRWLHIFQSAVSLKLSSIGMSKTCRKSRRWEGTVLHSMPSNHQKNGFTMKRKATAISMNGINRRTAEFYVASNNKSYYHRFTTINFAKLSWRALQSMIPFIANPTIFVEKYRTARIYSSWRFLPPSNTPDLFCRRFTRQNFSPVLQGGIFLLGSCTLNPT